MQNIRLLTKLARISAALTAASLLGFWIASSRGDLFGLEPQHFVWDTVLFFLLAMYLRLDGFFSFRESHAAAAREKSPVEEVVEIHSGETAAVSPSVMAAGAQPAWKSPYVLAAAIIGGSLLVAGLLLSDSKPSGSQQAAAVAPAAPQAQAPALQPQAPAPQQPSAPVNVSEDDDPFIGKKDAPVTIVEFSDFQCPFCRSFWQQTLPEITKQYIDTGKVKFVYRDYPLSFHPMATPVAEAAECADDQGQFWEFHDVIFAEQAKQGGGTVQFTIDDVKLWAAQVSGLNTTKLAGCIDAGTHRAEVQKDVADGNAAGVSGTPTLFINGQRIVGAQPFASFSAIIDAELTRLGQ